MLNLNHFQQLFEIKNTTERCERVLEEIEPRMQRVVNRFLDSQEEIRRNREDYSVKSYAVTLRTTYHDSQNPKYAESKKNTNIGKRHSIQVQKKIGPEDINIMTIEMNGIDSSLRVSVESRFYPVWTAVARQQMDGLIAELPGDLELSLKASSFKKETVAQGEFVDKIRELSKTMKRPPLYFGKTLTLEGSMEEDQLVELMTEVYNKTASIRTYLEEEKQESIKANHILGLFKEREEEQRISLMRHEYTLKYGKTENFRTGLERQMFYLYDQDQLLVKGAILYFEFSEKDTPTQRFAIRFDGKTTIFAKVRELMEEEVKPWWILKPYTKKEIGSRNAHDYAFQLLSESGIETEGKHYLVGHYNNTTKAFEEDIDLVKERLIKAGLIFAHAYEKITLPEKSAEEEEETDTEEDSDEKEVDEVLKSNFDFNGIIEHVNSSALTFSHSVIRDFHLNLTALEDKHFVILSGISGTGKTQLAKLYANAVYGLDFEEDNPYLSIIPVRPDWMDASALFGYYSSFEKRYVMTEFLRMVLKAQKERDKPHFILLDEMNLARVEYYLSDYLSAVESQKEVPLHNADSMEEIPQKLSIPPNIYVIGTINVDETTHAISDKVLDRAYVMTLSDVDFDPFWESTEEHIKNGLKSEFNLIKEIHGILLPYDLHFGYRTMNEMLKKLAKNKELDEEYRMDQEEAVDVVVAEKVLPKIRGVEIIDPLLSSLINIAEERISPEGKTAREADEEGAGSIWNDSVLEVSCTSAGQAKIGMFLTKHS